MQPEEPTPAEGSPIDFRTATAEEVTAEHIRMRNDVPQQPGPDYADVDWKNVPREEFYAEAAKRGIYLRRWGH